MADPTHAQVQAAMAVLAAAETAREAANPVAVPVEPVKPSTPAVAPVKPTPKVSFALELALMRARAADAAKTKPKPKVSVGPASTLVPVLPSAPVVAAVVAPAMPVAATATLDALISTHEDIAAALKAYRPALVGVGEHTARQAVTTLYANVIETKRKQNLLQ